MWHVKPLSPLSHILLSRTMARANSCTEPEPVDTVETIEVVEIVVPNIAASIPEDTTDETEEELSQVGKKPYVDPRSTIRWRQTIGKRAAELEAEEKEKEAAEKAALAAAKAVEEPSAVSPPQIQETAPTPEKTITTPVSTGPRKSLVGYINPWSAIKTFADYWTTSPSKESPSKHEKPAEPTPEPTPVPKRKALEMAEDKAQHPSAKRVKTGNNRFVVPDASDDEDDTTTPAKASEPPKQPERTPATKTERTPAKKPEYIHTSFDQGNKENDEPVAPQHTPRTERRTVKSVRAKRMGLTASAPPKTHVFPDHETDAGLRRAETQRNMGSPTAHRSKDRREGRDYKGRRTAPPKPKERNADKREENMTKEQESAARRARVLEDLANIEHEQKCLNAKKEACMAALKEIDEVEAAAQQAGQKRKRKILFDLTAPNTKIPAHLPGKKGYGIVDEFFDVDEDEVELEVDEDDQEFAHYNNTRPAKVARTDANVFRPDGDSVPQFATPSDATKPAAAQTPQHNTQQTTSLFGFTQSAITPMNDQQQAAAPSGFTPSVTTSTDLPQPASTVDGSPPALLDDRSPRSQYIHDQGERMKEKYLKHKPKLPSNLSEMKRHSYGFNQILGTPSPRKPSTPYTYGSAMSVDTPNSYTPLRQFNEQQKEAADAAVPLIAAVADRLVDSMGFPLARTRFTAEEKEYAKRMVPETKENLQRVDGDFAARFRDYLVANAKDVAKASCGMIVA